MIMLLLVKVLTKTNMKKPAKMLLITKQDNVPIADVNRSLKTLSESSDKKIAYLSLCGAARLVQTLGEFIQFTCEFCALLLNLTIEMT